MTSVEQLFDRRHFAARVKQRRGPMGLREAAQELGTSPSTLDRVEHGKLVPNVEFFLRLCAWIEASPLEFFSSPVGESGEPDAFEQVARALRRGGSIDPDLAEAIITLLGLLYKRPAS